MESTITEEDWTTLLDRIEDGKCTPFIGAGMCAGSLPLGSDIARKWAKEFNYPIKDCSDLVKIAQYVALKHDSMFPKERIIKIIKENKTPDFSIPNDPHGILSELPFRIYLTTNYDDFMMRALKNQNKRPERELCLWNNYLKGRPTMFESDYEPQKENPLVFHLHGTVDIAESIVLTEDDYLDFLVNISNNSEIIPLQIKAALSGASLMFIGYKLEDWDFKVLFRGLVSSKPSILRRISVTVQLEPEMAEIKDYLNKYFDGLKMKVYWGTACEFTTELKRRWEEHLKKRRTKANGE